MARKTPNDLQNLGLGAKEMNDEGGDGVHIRSGDPVESSFVKVGDLFSELIVNLPVEGNQRSGDTSWFSHRLLPFSGPIVPRQHDQGAARRRRSLRSKAEGYCVLSVGRAPDAEAVDLGGRCVNRLPLLDALRRQSSG